MRYTFGDTITANERLKTIADFFNPLSAEFIYDNLHIRIHSLLDLGCGPGYTTEMLAKTTNAHTVSGIDISDSFLDFARNRYHDYSFIKHDVRHTPLLVKADLMFSRFLLSHLKNIRHLIDNWLQDLNPGGLLVIDELEAIYTQKEVFCDYLSLNEGLIRSQGADLFIGKVLSQELNGFRIIRNTSSLIPVFDHLAAKWFYPNTISIWESDEWMQSRLDVTERKIISAELLRLSKNISEKSSVTWRMRRMILTNNED